MRRNGVFHFPIFEALRESRGRHVLRKLENITFVKWRACGEQIVKCGSECVDVVCRMWLFALHLLWAHVDHRAAGVAFGNCALEGIVNAGGDAKVG